MKPQISIIIPVYNTEQFLKSCINSLINQSFENCEFIFVDDGSTDQSCNLIRSYKKNDNRIKLVMQDNKGVSSARNTGILNSKGEYIGFVDSDDYIESDMYEILYKEIQIEDCDVIISHFEEELNGYKRIKTYNLIKNELMDKTYIQNYHCL